MGSFMSGRPRTRNRGAVEHWPDVDLRYLKRRGWLASGRRGTLTWTWGSEVQATARFAVSLEEGDPHVFIALTAGGFDRDQVVSLEALPCRYGGVRYLMVCPASGRRCVALFWSNDHGRFVSRQSARYTYACQGETRTDRMRRAYRKAEARASGQEGFPKPRGDNRRRLEVRAQELEAAYAASWYGAFRARFGKHFEAGEV